LVHENYRIGTRIGKAPNLVPIFIGGMYEKNMVLATEKEAD